MSLGHIHHPAAKPGPWGNFTRASKRPYVWAYFVKIIPVGYGLEIGPHGAGLASFVALSVKRPSATPMCDGSSTKHSPTGLNPVVAVVIGTHLLRSRVVPSNSSENVQFQSAPDAFGILA